MSHLNPFVSQSMFVMFPAAEVAYRRERIAADFARSGRGGHHRRRSLRRREQPEPMDDANLG